MYIRSSRSITYRLLKTIRTMFQDYWTFIWWSVTKYQYEQLNGIFKVLCCQLFLNELLTVASCQHPSWFWHIINYKSKCIYNASACFWCMATAECVLPETIAWSIFWFSADLINEINVTNKFEVSLVVYICNWS